MAFRGRCFRCKKPGHTVTQFPSKKRSKGPKLSDLPVELLEMICGFLVHPPGYKDISYMFRTMALRLTCRTINQKTTSDQALTINHADTPTRRDPFRSILSSRNFSSHAIPLYKTAVSERQGGT
ncbi:hypothetical protein BU23DRAFT_549823 [Bimuria novae-zelandiae CBS 107.79]|uniref:Uncharacterized protein n=1 Tax=Bimuria novae-zelandiae CBS 107.79 TaxID=1447943 RepID=A0A6A5VM88_9PLEO|nr:hypothetical protein BU23DRAFT_549823 [Bimuria novae-zelandiae CBS 107.79]